MVDFTEESGGGRPGKPDSAVKRSTWRPLVLAVDNVAQTSGERPDITLYVNVWSGGGVERVAVMLCNALAACQQRVHLVVGERHEGRYWSELHPDVEVLDLEGKNRLLALGAMTRYLLVRRPRRLMCFMPTANTIGLMANLAAGRPARVTVSEHMVLSDLRKGQTGVASAMSFLVPLVYRAAESVICVSESIAADLRRHAGCPRKKIAVIHNGVDSQAIQRLQRQPVPHEWLTSGRSKVLIAVGRLSPEKNHALLLHAFAAVRETHAVRLLILGEGDERPQLEQLARDLGIADSVCLAGWVANPYACLARSAAFVTCSITEGFGLALLEALICGCPVIATDCSGAIREILGEAEFGVLVPNGDAGRLAAAIRDVLDNPGPAQERTEAFHRSKAPAFSLDVMLRHYRERLQL